MDLISSPIKGKSFSPLTDVYLSLNEERDKELQTDLYNKYI